MILHPETSSLGQAEARHFNALHRSPRGFTEVNPGSGRSRTIRSPEARFSTSTIPRQRLTWSLPRSPTTTKRARCRSATPFSISTRMRLSTFRRCMAAGREGLPHEGAAEPSRAEPSRAPPRPPVSVSNRMVPAARGKPRGTGEDQGARVAHCRKPPSEAVRVVRLRGR